MSIESNPLISVVMSVYNGGDYLSSAIESILKQSYSNFEFVIVNDGSTDDSLSVITNYMELDSRIVLVDQNNMGLTKSLNKAIGMSRGAYIARQDADDESLPFRLERQLACTQANKLDLLTSRAFKNMQVVPNLLMLNLRKESCLKAGNVFIHGTFFGPRSTFVKVRYNERYVYAQDFKFILDCIYNGLNIGYDPEATYILNDIESNISNRKSKQQKEHVYMSLIEHFGSDRLFRILCRFNGLSLKVIKISAMIILNFSRGRNAFNVIKK
ncbi:glycosyltransferase family 2 protein [Vibrio coralliilyticus]|uniref:glycosyltransferase family 2 protein n=1 Tax=Vibrio coralliilyticus TaxID=190893 RepID=UPI00148D4E0E|nr:glycosyltransferase family 2 protein [Vibrio coralliilyticus]NOH54517.1 glycosyltransferase family 2 protein [Vibrio coralliilyticus]